MIDPTISSAVMGFALSSFFRRLTKYQSAANMARATIFILAQSPTYLKFKNQLICIQNSLPPASLTCIETFQCRTTDTGHYYPHRCSSTTNRTSQSDFQRQSEREYSQISGKSQIAFPGRRLAPRLTQIAARSSAVAFGWRQRRTS